MRFSATLASVVFLGLVLAAPSVASDGESLRPPVPGVPELVVFDVGPISSPQVGPVLLNDEIWSDESQIVTDQDAAPGFAGASVPVLSPGPDDPSADKDATAVVSAILEPDITAPDPVSDAPHEAPDALLPPHVETNAPAPVPSTGNVAVISQADDSAGAEPTDADLTALPNLAGWAAAAEPPSGTQPRSGPVSGSSDPEIPVSEINSPRYHERDSQYQSEEQSEQDPWHWTWSLTLDCAGNVMSTSSQTGSQESMVWDWDWVWDWACGSTGSNTSTNSSGSSTDFSSTSDTGNTNVSVHVSSPGDTGLLTQSTVSAGVTEGVTATGATSGGVWNWSWTFAFCGETTLVSTQIDSQTPLSWTWNWTWNWTCDAAASPSPELGGASPSVPDAAPVPPLVPVISALSDLPTPALTPVFTADVPLPVWLPLPTRQLVPSIVVDVAILVGPGALLQTLPELPLPSPAISAISGVDVSVVIVSAETSQTSAPQADLTAEGGHAVPGHRDTESTDPLQTTAPIAWQRPEGSSRGPSSNPTAKPPSARPAPPRRAHGPLLPFGQPRSSETAGSSAFGGRVPSVPVAAVAALIAFFMLAAPHLGRRNRVARELSPRSTYRSSIDHPG